MPLAQLAHPVSGCPYFAIKLLISAPKMAGPDEVCIEGLDVGLGVGEIWVVGATVGGFVGMVVGVDT